MKVAKHFRWEAAHRLPWHEGVCRNLHGHSYRMTVELKGEPDDRGILMDFKVLKHLLAPLVDEWDHAMLVAESDEMLCDVARRTGWKHVMLPFDSTAENLSTFVLNYLTRTRADVLRASGVQDVRVRIAETETSYAEAEQRVELPVVPASNRMLSTDILPGKR